jgi:hypothetical protein
VTKRHQPRNYLETLEQRVVLLEDMLRDLRPDIASDATSSSDDRRAINNRQLSKPDPRTVDSEHHELGDLSSMIGTLSLNAAGAEPHYLGSSSAFAFARFVEPALRQVVSSMPAVSKGDRHDQLTPEPCPLPDYQTAVKLSNAYFRNIHPQYPFLHEPTFRMWETALKDPFQALDILNYGPVPLYFLNMVCLHSNRCGLQC